jgi:hypothetical protein
MAKKKIDPLNKKQYGAVSVMLTVSERAFTPCGCPASDST